MPDQKRNTAYKVWISNLMNSEYAEGKGEWESNYFKLNGKDVSRVNIIGNVIFSFKSEDNNYRSISLDDGSAVIRLKCWREDVGLLENIETGDMVLVIGKVKKYENEVYVMPEIVKKLDDANWEIVRKLELFREYGKFNELNTVNLINNDQENSTEDVVKTEVVSNDDRQKILNLIEKSDGITAEELKNKVKLGEDKIEDILMDLLKEGEIYESRAGVYMII